MKRAKPKRKEPAGPALRDTVWLIEGDGCYWSGCGMRPDSFTKKVDHALQFARKQDAEVVKERLFPEFAFALRATSYSCPQSEEVD